jgi:hypothetical protein
VILGDNAVYLQYPGCDLFIEDITYLYDLFCASLDDVTMKLDKFEIKDLNEISHINKTQIAEFEIIGYRDLDTFSRSCVLLKFEKYSTSLTLSDSSNSLFLGMKSEIDHFIRKKQRFFGSSKTVWSAWCIGMALMSVIPTIINAQNPFLGKIISISGIILTAVTLYNIWVNYTNYNQIFLLHLS